MYMFFLFETLICIVRSLTCTRYVHCLRRSISVKVLITLTTLSKKPNVLLLQACSLSLHKLRLVEIIEQLHKVVFAASILNGCISKRFTREPPHGLAKCFSTYKMRLHKRGVRQEAEKTSFAQLHPARMGPTTALATSAPMPAHVGETTPWARVR